MIDHKTSDGKVKLNHLNFIINVCNGSSSSLPFPPVVWKHTKSKPKFDIKMTDLFTMSFRCSKYLIFFTVTAMLPERTKAISRQFLLMAEYKALYLRPISPQFSECHWLDIRDSKFSLSARFCQSRSRPDILLRRLGTYSWINDTQRILRGSHGITHYNCRCNLSGHHCGGLVCWLYWLQWNFKFTNLTPCITCKS